MKGAAMKIGILVYLITDTERILRIISCLISVLMYHLRHG